MRAQVSLSGAEFMGVENQGLLTVADTILQNGANSVIGSVCK